MDLKQLFSPLSECPSHRLPFRKLALLGPLPASTCLHTAISFVQRYNAESAEQEALLDIHEGEDAGGSRSRPIREPPYVLILSSSRSQLHASMVQENDEYLANRGGDPSVTRILRDYVDIRFFDTMAAWTFFCSACQLKVPEDEAPPSDIDEKALREHGKLAIRRSPDLLILEGLTRFLDEERNTGAGIEVYSSLLACTISTFTALENFRDTATQMVFLDDPGDKYRAIALLPSHLNSTLRKRKRPDIAEETPTVPTSALEVRRMEMKKIYNYFVDAVGTVTDGGGMEDLVWYDIKIQPSPRWKSKSQVHDPQHREEENLIKDVDVRFAIRRVEDTGYSGRDRFQVKFT